MAGFFPLTNSWLRELGTRDLVWRIINNSLLHFVVVKWMAKHLRNLSSPFVAGIILEVLLVALFAALWKPAQTLGFVGIWLYHMYIYIVNLYNVWHIVKKDKEIMQNMALAYIVVPLVLAWIYSRTVTLASNLVNRQMLKELQDSFERLAHERGIDKYDDSCITPEWVRIEENKKEKKINGCENSEDRIHDGSAVAPEWAWIREVVERNRVECRCLECMEPESAASQWIYDIDPDLYQN